MKYKFDADGVCEIPELGMHFSFKAIDPERKTKCGAWPYCISYQYKGLDAFGLGDYGSNKRVEHADNAEAILNELIAQFKDRSLEAMEIARLGSREYQVGHKYVVRFVKPGLFHKGTYFESHADIKRYFARANFYGEERAEALVSHAASGEYLGKYIKHSNGEIEFIKPA